MKFWRLTQPMTPLGFRVGVVICGLLLSVAQGALAFGIRSSRGAMLGGSLSMSNPSATDFLSAPGLVGADRMLYLDAGVARRFNLSELDIGYLALGYRRGNLLFSLGVQQSGSTDLFAEQVARLALGYQLRNVSASVTLSSKRFEFGGGYQALNASALGFGAGVSTSYGTLRATVDNINNPSFSQLAPKEPRQAAVFAEYTGNHSYTISASAHFEEDAIPDFGLGQTVTLTDYAKLSWGISSEPLIYGAGFEIRQSRITFIYAGSIHPALGFSQSLTLSVQLAGGQRK